MDDFKRMLAEHVDEALSDAQIEEMMGNRATVITYSKLKNVTDIDQILNPYGVAFILYEWKKNYGHWCLLIRSGKLLEFFNPYGGMPDDELDNVKPELRKQLGEDKPYLSNLLRECPYEISYNEFQFQKLASGVKTCGRWCIMRAYFKDMDLYDFQRLFYDMYGDEIVTYLTSRKQQ